MPQLGMKFASFSTALHNESEFGDGRIYYVEKIMHFYEYHEKEEAEIGGWLQST